MLNEIVAIVLDVLIENKKPLSFDEILEYCKSNPIYDEVLLKYPDKILEYELDGKIAIKDGKVFVL